MGLWLGAAFFLGLLINLILPFECSHQEPLESPVILLPGNVTVEGILLTAKDGTVYHAFLGVPYGKIEERFQDPKLVDYGDWTDGRINATVDPPKCTQINQTTNEIEGSEDCLYCNIYVPATCNKWGCGVLIWYHGGGYQTGPTGDLKLIFQYLMNKNTDVVAVFCRYRLGPFGFMALDEHMPGNYGVKDVCLITVWVNKYIRHFGGNPGSVTAAGESAGANCAHLASEVCYPKYVHRVMISSGSIYVTYPVHKKQVVKATTLCAALVNCSGTDQEISDCLKKVDSKVLIKACNSYSIFWDPDTPLIRWAPIYGSEPIGNYLLEQGLHSYVPMVTGICKDEWILSYYIDMCPYVLPLLRFDAKYVLSFLLKKLDPTLSSEQRASGVQLLMTFYFKFNVSDVSDQVLCMEFAKVTADATIIFPWILTVCLHKGSRWNFIVEHSTDLNKEFSRRIGVTDQENPVPHACAAELWGNYRSDYYPNVPAYAPVVDYTVITRVNQAVGNFCRNSDPSGVPAFSWRPNCRKFEVNAINEVIDGPAPPDLIRRLIDVYKLWKNVFSGFPKCA